MQRSYAERGCSLGRGYAAIIAEKPKAAEKIARALGRPRKCRLYGVTYWVLERDGERIVVASTAGHLYGVYTSIRGFPVYDYVWRPLWEYDRSARHLKKFHYVLSILLPRASRYVNACDYDIEGSVIGYMIIESLGDPVRAYRMVYSSLSPVELLNSYSNLRRLDVEMVEAGKARHEMDWLWGINVSRALMDAVKRITGEKATLSAGRVQSPTLVEAVRRWREVELAVPTPSFTLTVKLEKGGVEFEAYPEGWEPESRREAEAAARGLRSNPWLRVESVEARPEAVNPPPAFNLGDLQAEAARLYKFSPMKTQRIAEDLYLDALISYPRTNSQKLPPTINYASIIDSLEANPTYSGLIGELKAETRGVYRPVQGRKEDPAHPAIYPTGLRPGGLDGDHFKVYDLIVRRFLAAFSRPARIERASARFSDYEGRGYASRGVKVLEEGWWRYYVYHKPREVYLPGLAVGERVRVSGVSYATLWASKRPNLSKTSLLKWMEAQGIGTEATRARIIEILYQRGYLDSRGGSTVATDLGMYVAEVIEELFPELAGVELTRRFEELVEAIRMGKNTRERVISETMRELNTLIAKYRLRLDEVGSKLASALGKVEPPEKCVICGRAASKSRPYKLCRYHGEAHERLMKALPLIMKRLEVGEREALELVASRRNEAGRWVVEAARYLLERLPPEEKG